MKKQRCVPDLVIEALRLVTVGVGVTDVVLTAYTYSTLYNQEIFFCTTVITTFVISLLFLIFHLLLFQQKDSIHVKYTDIGFHIVGGVLMFISGLFMMGAVIDRPADIQGVTVTRTTAAILGIENGVLYGLIGFLLSRKLTQAESRKYYGVDLEWDDALLQSQESNKSNFGTI